MSDVQRNLLNPTPKDVLLGFITYAVKGKGSFQKIAKRKIDFIEGNVNSYSRQVNNRKKLEAVKDHAQLVATVAEVSAEADDEKARKKLRREKDTAERARKKAALAEKEARKMEEMLPLLNSDVNKYTSRATEIEHNVLIKEIDKDLVRHFLQNSDFL